MLPHPSSSTPGIAPADYIAGLGKGLAVLECFDTERQRLNATLAAERAGLTRAAARRHLLTLAHLGYLESDGHHFWLTPKVLGLSGAYLASARLPRTVQPVLNRLSAMAAYSFSAAILAGSETVVIARSTAQEGAQQLYAHGVHLGSRMPAHAASTGLVLLAALSDKALDEWLACRRLHRLTLHTLTQPEELRAFLARVRAQDYCIAQEGHELGVQAIAVPLRNSAGETVAALNAVMSAQRMSAQALERQMLPLLRDAAQELRPLL
ncbi:IclR family transcriptional regulator domain-containing protein [Comamonas antarctica]|uniref:Helix-turn-helix domain-containing protein n=1 Tax=Comamonas antarctica TaxID=2743470 RepID=A0A6N1X6H5_9BURK|nr:IclR family transcriptional regulator C-terminal domain-containing protein [Comamonas antarctica]QKV53366.1 helix-turn-helix domain-containing protein [Comamonas antarctica]